MRRYLITFGPALRDAVLLLVAAQALLYFGVLSPVAWTLAWVGSVLLACAIMGAGHRLVTDQQRRAKEDRRRETAVSPLPTSKAGRRHA